MSTRDLQSLHFTVNRFFNEITLYRMSDMAVVACCQSLFHVDLPSVVIQRRFEKLECNINR